MARIAVVDLTFNWPPVGGCWVDLKEIADRLVRAGHRLELFVPRFQDYYPRGKVETDLSFPVHPIPFNRFTYNIYLVGRRLQKALRAFGPDLVFVGDGYFMKGALLPYLAEWPVVLRFYAYELICFNLHYYLYREGRVCDGNFIEDPARCHRCWYTSRLSLPKHVLGILAGVEDRHPALHFSQEYLGSLAFTRYYRRHLAQWLGIPRAIIVYNPFIQGLLSPYNSNTRIIPSGVNTRRFALRESGAEPGGPPAILMTGRVNDPLKGFPTVREACDRLHREGLEFKLLITSAYPVDFEAPYLENLGWVDQEQLPSLYHKGAISLVPSTWIEPFGITAVESMAAGLPVVASRIGGLETSVVDGQTGFLLPPGDAGAMTDCLRNLLADGALRRRLGQAGRRRAEEEYDWDVLVDRHYLPLVQTLTE